MLVTEKDAREMWCPQSMNDAASPDSSGPYRCKVTRCMGWRVAGKKAGVEVGYCGLAGTPAVLVVALQRRPSDPGDERRILTFDPE